MIRKLLILFIVLIFLSACEKTRPKTKSIMKDGEIIKLVNNQKEQNLI